MADKTSTQFNASDEDFNKLCDLCKRQNKEVEAGVYCQDCKEHLCHMCEGFHKVSKASRNHVLQNLQIPKAMSSKKRELISSIMTCHEHSDQVVSLICTAHNTPICTMCHAMKHWKCKTETVEGVAKEPKSQQKVCQYKQKVETLQKELKQIRERADNDKALIHQTSEECLQRVNDIKHKIVTWAEDLANNMAEKIKQTKDKLLIDLDKEEKILTQMDKQIKEIANSLKTLGHDMDKATFVFMKKEGENVQTMSELTKEKLKQSRPAHLEFQQSEKLTVLMKEIASFGELNSKYKSLPLDDTEQLVTRSFCFTEMSSLTKKAPIRRVRSGWISGCTFMPDGELVVCDRANDSVKVFTRDFKLRNEIQMGSMLWDVAALSKREAIVTLTKSNCLQRLDTLGNIKKGKSIYVGRRCFGVDYKNNQLYVSCSNEDAQRGEVIVLTLEGVTLKNFTIRQGNPSYIAANGTGTRILVSTGKTGVLCFGSEVYTYSDGKLDWSRGVLFDSDDNFMVCGQCTNNIHVVRSNGTKHAILVRETDGLDGPYCLAYRPGDRTLVVGQSSSNALMSFTIK